MSDRIDRVRRMMRHPGAWLEARGATYDLRLGPDRRARVTLRLAEAEFRALIARPGLSPRPGGGWRAARGVEPSMPPSPGAPAPGCPGLIEGRRVVMDVAGRAVSHRANLGESPIAWLARRKDHAGRPWLTPAEVAAGERLRRDGERAGAGASLTMRWDALPRGGSGGGLDRGPTDRALAAGARVRTALAAVGPDLAAMLDRICLRGTALQLAEQDLGLRRRQGKTVLKQALARLAVHYGIG